MATKDISTEYTAWDNVETVYVTVYVDGKAQPRKKLDYALRVNDTQGFGVGGGIRGYSQDVTWWLPVGEMGTLVPDSNAKIEVSSDEKYRAVTSATLVRLGSSKSHWVVPAVAERGDD